MATISSPCLSVEETLARLCSKHGVSAALAIDRTTACVLHGTGALAAIFASSAVPPNPASCTSAAAYTMETAPSVVAAGSTSLTSPSPSLPGATAINEDEAKDGTAEDRATERFAKMVWGYVNSTGELVHDMDSEDDVKLLRLRTKKHELVIVPDPKYIFVVVHDVPS
ncbi:hypothetical protein MBM_07209 [Drepanopeziza brunnea f. sp. 'multigermtubi' MB_m1]|uniref:Roadblock/LAMTOR2 domain-containing protein n=1 Tax=Marssonina brunnea f. sp. multigermtubi (strain MB_m1) TaxID=1072389 RepID=K1X0V4_MARBU|nr:uncharacterized protein MBM_07209 [Drepanopeziza brunnea f. sp. 'multigermtubi' MB_m1]EKD14488.1 hypothetical protein MBM_07209 [Drepanopeziza brunnea f. sp. 'multigermtubi' MB_m1]